MNFLVVSGAPSTGKTTALNQIAEWLRVKYSISTDFYGNSLPSFLPDSTGKYWDFSIVIILNGRKIIIHSATDDINWMDKLVELIKQNPESEIVITSCRDIYWERDYFMTNVRPFSTFFLESPLGKITRRKDFALADNWYKDTLLELHKYILTNNPYNL